MLKIFSPEKIRRLRPGLKPRTRLSEPLDYRIILRHIKIYSHILKLRLYQRRNARVAKRIISVIARNELTEIKSCIKNLS
jgi:hypothetical protein